MDKDLLKQVLSIPSCYKKETLVKQFLIIWANDNGIDTMIDLKGNVFLKKGEIKEGEAFPCVVAHMDTVHSDQKGMVDRDESLTIQESNGQYGDILYAQKETEDGLLINTGIGGDDKAGLFIALELIKNFDNIMGAFFVEEEIGCLGSKEAKDNEWLNEVGYFIQFDAPTGDWISRNCDSVELFNDDFANKLEPVWKEYGLKSPNTRDPFTDVKELKINYPVCCINYFAGYMDMHTRYEFVVLEYVEKAIKVGASTIIELGPSRYEFKHNDWDEA